MPNGSPTTGPTAVPSTTPSLVPSSSPSSGSNTNPSAVPSSVPSSSPSALCVLGATQTSSEGTTRYSENPIAINSFDGETVIFSLTQEWTVDCSVDWIATTYSVADGNTRCDKENVVVPQASFSYTATCVEGWAHASVYVYDNNFNTTDNPIVPAFCGDDVDVVGNKVAYNFSIPCECDELPPMDGSPSPAPTSICEYYDVSFDDKDVSPGTYVSGQWNEYGLRLSAEELDDGTGGFMPNGYPRLFDTAAPVNGEGCGTPGHTGDCLLYTSPSPRDLSTSRMPSSA